MNSWRSTTLEPFTIRASAALVDGKLTEALLHIGADGRFAEEVPEGSRTIIIDDGTAILPGFIDLHVNFLPRLLSARIGVDMPAAAAAAAYDAVLMASGITTAFHLVPIHRWAEDEIPMRKSLELLSQFHNFAQQTNIDLFPNIALEVLDTSAVELFFELSSPYGSVVSLTEHLPGHREFRARPHALIDRLSHAGVPKERVDELVNARRQELSANVSSSKETVSEYCRHRSIPVFSHDDEFVEDVDYAVGKLGATLLEFPLTEAAASAGTVHGVDVLVGAPNVMRGASHVGNVSARYLVQQGNATILSGDYAPYTILPAISLLRRSGFDWPELSRLVSYAPARAAGLSDRGQIAPGKLADFVRVRETEGEVMLVELWKAGLCMLRLPGRGVQADNCHSVIKI